MNMAPIHLASTTNTAVKLGKSAGTMPLTAARRWTLRPSIATDAEGHQDRVTDPAGIITEYTFDDADNIVTTTVGFGTASALTTSYTYDVDGSRLTTTSPSGAITTIKVEGCCGRSRGTRNGLGHGNITNMDSGGRTIHTATVEDFDTHTDFHNPIDATTLSESTTRYYGNGQVQFRTRWKTPLGNIDATQPPPIAGIDGVAATNGVTTQNLYDSRLGDGVGLDSTTGVDAKLLGGGADVGINIQEALTKLADTQANGGAGISFSSTDGGQATVAISADELTMQVSISDASGRGVMSALMHGPKAASGDINKLIDWNCTLHDQTYTIAGTGFGLSQAIVRIDADGETTKSFTNGFGHGVGSMDQLGNVSKVRNGPKGEPRYSYNADGKLTQYDYDALGRRISMTDPLSQVVESKYDSAGRMNERIDAKGESTITIFDDLGRVKEVQDRTGKSTHRTYDTAGRLATIKDAENRTTTYGYDILGRRTSTTLPDNSSRAMAYDAAGRITRVDLPSGKSKTNVYINAANDIAGLLRKVEYRDATDTLVGSDTLTYDDLLRRTGSTSRYGVTQAMAYDHRSQMSSESTTYGGQTYSVAYERDDRGRMTKVTYPSGRIVEYAHTVRGMLDTIKVDSDEIEDRDYNAIGQLTAVDRPSIDETRTYDDRGQVTTIGNGSVGTATYAYDANGNKLSESWSGAMSSWNFTTQVGGNDGYDAEDRFLNFNQSGQSKTLAMTRSDIGNITNINLNSTNTARGYSNVHELTSVGSNTQSFDSDGNLATATSGDTYDWDEGGMMKQANVSGGPTVEYGYGAGGKRIWKKVTDGATVTETVYIHSGPNCIAEYAKGAAPTSSGNEYVYAGGIDSLVMLLRTGGTEKLSITRNQQWSVSALVDNTGSVVERYTYDEFGKRTMLAANGSTVRTSSSYDMPYGYTSRRHEPETGLMHFRARYYDPTTGEFISRDPLEYVDGMSLYGGYFVPSGLDPTGSVCIKCHCKFLGEPKEDVSGWFKTECGGLASTCCRKKCGSAWTGKWRICNAIPDTRAPSTGSCPQDWRNTNDMLDCVGCCLKASEVLSVVEQGVNCYTVARPLKPLRPNGTIDTFGSSAKRWKFSWRVNSTEHCLTKTYVKCGIPRNTIRCVNRFCIYYVIVEGFIDWGRIGYCTEACRRKFNK